MKFIKTTGHIIFDDRFDNYFLIKIKTKVKDTSTRYEPIIELTDQIKVNYKKDSIDNKMKLATNKLDELIKNHPYFLLQKCESPIEIRFYVYALSKIPGIKPQIWVDEYRVDFAIPDKKFVIELDGHEYHKTREQRTSDAKRERHLINKGWQVLRFTGSEIYEDVTGRIEEIKTMIKKA